MPVQPNPNAAFVPRGPDSQYAPSFLSAPPPQTPVQPTQAITPTPVVPTAQQVVNSTRDGTYYGNAIIRDYEQFEPNAYWDPKGKVWTYGWGFTKTPDGRPVREGDKIKQSDADAYLQRLISGYERELSSRYRGWASLEPHERGAMLDLAHNLGTNWERFPNVNRILSERNPNRKALAAEIPTFRMAGGQVVEGLVNRRADTLKMFKGEYNDGYVSRTEREAKPAKPAKKSKK